MKKTLTILLIFTAIIFISSCVMSEKRADKLRALLCHGDSVTTNDSTSTTTTENKLVDSTYYFTAQALYTAMFECDSNRNIVLLKYDSIYKTNKALSTSIKLVGNTVYINNKIDSAAIYLQYFNTHKTTNTKVKNDKKEVTPPIYIEKPIKGYYKFVSWGFWILLVGIVAYIVWRIFRMKIKIDLTAP